MHTFVALMPLRGGSKGIPGKNLVSLQGHPLFYWGLKAALDSQIFSSVWVSTEDDLIAKAVQKTFGHHVQILERPKALALDETSTEAVMLHFAEQVSFDVISLVQATSPFTIGQDFVLAKKIWEESNFDSLLSVCELKRFIWNHSGQALNYDPKNRPRRQDFEGYLVENGAFYFTKRDILTSIHSRLGGKIGQYKMSDKTFFEVDEPMDLAIIDRIWHE